MSSRFIRDDTRSSRRSDHGGSCGHFVAASESGPVGVSDARTRCPIHCVAPGNPISRTPT